jgi:hypothetical protein
MADERYWTYRAGTLTPSFGELPNGAFNGTQKAWESLSPGMRREIFRSFVKRYPPCPVPLPVVRK